ncbi:MAG TPA: von Willebrand factor type A domain-containing protein [Gammaproteobacteria bacterium]
MKRLILLVILPWYVALLLAACSTPKTSPDGAATTAIHGNTSQDQAAQPQPVDAANTPSATAAVGESTAVKDRDRQPPNLTPAKPRHEERKLAADRQQALTHSEQLDAAGSPVERFAEPSSAAPLTKRIAPLTAPVGVASNVQPEIRYPSEPVDREHYAHFADNPVLRVAEQPVSTFSIDVDTGSYTNTRRILREGRLPAKDVVRVEEFINYFNYDYPAPDNQSAPFNVVTEVGPAPWNANTHLLHIGIKGYEVPSAALPPANLVFLADVSGSMLSADKLPLLKKSLQLLTQKLRAQDKISIVVYAGASGVVLEPTAGSEKAAILSALESLTAGGSTNGGAGIRLAYLKAQQAFIPNGINRVILATDGDFNVGTTNFDALKDLVEEQRNTGIFLTTLGFGTGNYNDQLMEQLADAGNGNYAYIDTLMEAQKVLVNEMGATLNTIAKDVKIQIEFNPAVVAEYRLIGYENRALRREDFNNDKVDAGEIGAGHTVTAIYEIALLESKGQLMDPLRYQATPSSEVKVAESIKEIALLRLRYKKPDAERSVLMETPVLKQHVITALDKTSERYRFAASVAGFGQLLRGGRFTQSFSYVDVAAMAVTSKGADHYGYRGEFVQLVELARTLSGAALPSNAKAPDGGRAVN